MPKEVKESVTIDKSMECSLVMLHSATMVDGGLIGAETSIGKTKCPGIKMYMQANGMVFCHVEGKKGWFAFPPGNVKSYTFVKEAKIE